MKPCSIDVLARVCTDDLKLLLHGDAGQSRRKRSIAKPGRRRGQVAPRVVAHQPSHADDMVPETESLMHVIATREACASFVPTLYDLHRYSESAARTVERCRGHESGQTEAMHKLWRIWVTEVRSLHDFERPMSVFFKGLVIGYERLAREWRKATEASGGCGGIDAQLASQFLFLWERLAKCAAGAANVSRALRYGDLCAVPRAVP